MNSVISNILERLKGMKAKKSEFFEGEIEDFHLYKKVMNDPLEIKNEMELSALWLKMKKEQQTQSK